MKIYPMTEEALYLVRNFMRESDRNEIAAATGRPSAEALQYTAAITNSAYELCTNQGVPVAIFGVNDGTLPGEKHRWGIPWLVGTDWIDEHPVGFLRETKRMVSLLEPGYDILWNLCLNSNKRTLRWLAWAGFKFEKPKPFGPFGALFNPFFKVVNTCASIQFLPASASQLAER